MSTQIERMENLMKSLPKKDILLGKRFLKERDFDSLKELVDSALYKIKRNINSEEPKQEYLDINLEDLNRLKSEVDLYISIIEPDGDEFEDYDNVEEDIY